MPKSRVGPEEDLVVGGDGIVISTPAGDVLMTVAAIDGDQAEFHLDGADEALAYVDQSNGRFTERRAA